MDAGGDLADTGLHTSLITQICDILATFTDYHASIFSTNERAKSEGVLTSRGRGTRKVRGTYKADGQVSDYGWNDQTDDKHTGFTEKVAVMGVGGHGERRRGGGKEGGRRETGRGMRGMRRN